MLEKNIAEEIIERMTEAYSIQKGRGAPSRLAEKLGINASIISGWKTRGVPAHVPVRVALDTGVREAWLLTGQGEMRPSASYPTLPDPRARGIDGEIETKGDGPHWPALPPESLPVRAIPVLGRVPAGFPSQCPEEIIEYISLPNVPEGAYALIVHGESMAPTIRSGDYVIFMPGSDLVKNGDVVIVNNEWGESMCKRYREKGGERLLTSDNAEYPSVKPNGNYRILGRVIKVWRDIEF